MRTDRAKVNGRFTAIVVLHAVILTGVLGAGLWAAGESASLVAGGPFAILVISQVFQITVHAYSWGKRAAVDVAAVISGGGLWLAVPGYGSVTLPWPAVARIERRTLGRRLVVRPMPGVGPDTPGVQAPHDQRLWKLVHRRGLVLGLHGLDVDADTLSRAILQLSGGRVQVGG